VGDLNCPAIDWSCYAAPTDGVQDALLNFTLKNSFVQMITDCTRGTNIPCIIAFEKSSVSVYDIPVEKTFYFRQDADFISMKHFLSCVDWYQLLIVNLTANDLWSASTTVLQQAVDMFVLCGQKELQEVIPM
jgi:hypothetical protein